MKEEAREIAAIGADFPASWMPEPLAFELAPLEPWEPGEIELRPVDPIEQRRLALAVYNRLGELVLAR